MNLQQYQVSAKRTVNWKIEEHLQLAGFILGIVGELGELRRIIEGRYTGIDTFIDGIKDEGGDVLWYVVNLCSQFGIDWTNIFPETTRDFATPRQLYDAAQNYLSLIADAVKKKTVQGHALDMDQMIYNLQGMLGNILELFHYFNLTPEEVCEYNYEKLTRRYPNGFSEERSIYREA